MVTGTEILKITLDTLNNTIEVLCEDNAYLRNLLQEMYDRYQDQKMIPVENDIIGFWAKVKDAINSNGQTKAD
jgi:hypothetical protein